MVDRSLRLFIGLVVFVHTTCGANADDADFMQDPLKAYELNSSSSSSSSSNDAPWSTRDDRKLREAREAEERRTEDARRQAKRSDALSDSRDDDGTDTKGASSIFSRKSFIDSDFGKTSSRDLFIGKHDLNQDRREDNRFELSVDSDKSEFWFDGDEKTFLDRRSDRERRNYRTWKELTAPIPGALHDWVPDKPDPISNGAFTLSPDNGSPVPYHLNGHPNLERGVPWETDK